MKLWYDRKSKDPTYFMQMGIRNGKKVTTKNILRIGKHSQLLKEHADPLAYAKQFVEDYNRNLKKEKIEIPLNVNLNEKIKNSDNEDVSKSTLKNIGYLYLKNIYDQLGLKEYFDNITHDKKITFDSNTINMALMALRVLQPGSKLDNTRHFDNFYGLSDIDYQHVHRFLEILAENYDSYIEALFEGSEKVLKRNTSVCYFDCTNYYFEKEDEDEDVYDEVTGELIKGLLKYGISKEHRPNPIVQMGLFMDGDGIPLSMCINSGSDNESLCAVPAEKKLIEMFENKSVIYCSDAGLGYSNTRVFNSMGGRKFIVTQSIRKLADVYKEAIFNDCDYRYLENDKKVSLKHMQTFDKKDEKNLNDYNAIIYKSFETDSLVDLGMEEYKVLKNGNQKKVKSKGTLKQKVIVTYSRKMEEYQKTIRNRQIERAKQFLKYSDPESLKKNPNDFKRFIKKTSDEKSSYAIDENRINEEAKYDGFYALATNIFDEKEKDILKVNSFRYKIEDCFRVMKTNFEGRPVYHYKENKIRAHFLTCYTALLIYRLLEVKLNKAKHHFSTDKIIETLKNMNILSIEDAYYKSAYTGSNVLSSLEEIFQLNLDKKYYLAKDLSRLTKNK